MIGDETMDLYFENIREFKKAYPQAIICDINGHLKGKTYINFDVENFKKIDETQDFLNRLERSLKEYCFYTDKLFSVRVLYGDFALYMDMTFEKNLIFQKDTCKFLAYFIKPKIITFNKYECNMYGVFSPNQNPVEQGKIYF